MGVGKVRIAYENIQALFVKCLDDLQCICSPMSPIYLEPVEKGRTLWSIV
jgi:hypothetical protein